MCIAAQHHAATQRCTPIRLLPSSIHRTSPSPEAKNSIRPASATCPPLHCTAPSCTHNAPCSCTSPVTQLLLLPSRCSTPACLFPSIFAGGTLSVVKWWLAAVSCVGMRVQALVLRLVNLMLSQHLTAMTLCRRIPSLVHVVLPFPVPPAARYLRHPPCPRPCASTASPVAHVYDISLVICRPLWLALWFLTDGADRRSEAKPKQDSSPPPKELLFSPSSPYSGLHPRQIFRGARRQPKHLTLGDPLAHWPGRLPLPLPLADVPMHQSREGI